MTYNDRVLLIKGEWLNDEIVKSSQQLLQRKFQHFGWFQNVVLGRTLAYVIEPLEFVQIIHTGHGHWVTIFTIGRTTDMESTYIVFDSLPPAPTPDMLNQIAALLCTPNDIIKFNYIDVEIQDVFADCGVFAIAAFATCHDIN